MTSNGPAPTARGPRAPLVVRVAGVIVGVQGLAGLAFAVALLVRGVTVGQEPGENIYAMAGYFTVLGAGVLAVGVALVRSRHWARTPAIVVQLLLLGTAWYAIDGSARWEIGIPVAVLCVGVLVLLFVAASRKWVLGTEEGTGGRPG